jgi:hypothetical protein
MPSCRLSLKNWNPEISKTSRLTLGMGGLSLYKKDGPFAFVLSDYRFIPGPEIKDGVQLWPTLGSKKVT